MPKTVICLWFDTEGEEAAAHYTSIWPDSELLGVTRWGPENPEREGSALTVSFRLGDQEYVALNGGKQDFGFSEAVSFQIMCADQAEVDHYWSRLTDGGRESECSWLVDRFGVRWQVVPTRLVELLSDPDPGRAQRATAAMMQMQKIVIADLERAADQQPG